MASLEDNIGALSISDKLVDVTNHLKTLARHLQSESIIKAPQFDLFEGTHSLEINNTKLDSSLLKLSVDELNFDCQTSYGESDEEKVAFVTAIADRLCRSIMVWLNDYQTLPTTVLSCRYVEDMMYSFTEDPTSDLSTCRLKTGHEIYDQVLVSCILTTCYFVKVVQTFFKAGVVFEEEDLNCNTMGLNMLSTVALTTVTSHAENSLKLLRNKYPNAHQLALILQLLDSLARIHDLIPVDQTDSAADNRGTLEVLIRCAKQLKELPATTTKVPNGSFSPGIQKRLSNQFPPRAIVEPRGNEYDAFITMAEDILKVLEVDAANSVVEINQFAFFFNRSRQRHVVARALFPLYLMRDDQMILDKFTFNDFSKQHFMEFSLCGTQLATSLRIQPQDSPVVVKFESFMQEVSAVLFEWYQNASQNTCRYRQGYNRQLLLWDSLQAQIEVFEMELESQGIKDELGEENTLLPLTTWVYFMKLTAMMEFVLKGFELDVYKPWEFYTMYWYSYYLAQHLENNLQRVQRYLEQRIAVIQAMNKKLKKLKAGAKKDSLRSSYRWCMDHEMPQLRSNFKYVEYLLKKCTLSKTLALVEVFHFAIIKSIGVIDNRDLSSSRFSSPELVHKLRFKTFSSIGIPEFPSYSAFQNSLNEFMIQEPMFTVKFQRSVEFIQSELAKAKAAVDFISNAIRQGEDKDHELITGTHLVKDQALEYYESILKSIEALKSNTNSLHDQIGSKSPNSFTSYKVRVQTAPQACSYYPLLTLQKK